MVKVRNLRPGCLGSKAGPLSINCILSCFCSLYFCFLLCKTGTTLAHETIHLECLEQDFLHGNCSGNAGDYYPQVQTSPSPKPPLPSRLPFPFHSHEQAASGAPELASPTVLTNQHGGSKLPTSWRLMPRLGYLSPASSLLGPTTCSTSRAVYLLIASFTITHNNQLRHCQRNTHSWPWRWLRGQASCAFLYNLWMRRKSGEERERMEEKAETSNTSQQGWPTTS